MDTRTYDEFVLLPRRRLLGTVPVFAIGLSGCLGDAQESKHTPTPTASNTEETFRHCKSVASFRTARHSNGKPPLRSTAFTADSSWTSAEWVVATDWDRDALNYPATSNGIDSVKEYIADTDLSKHSILINQVEYNDCVTFEPRQIRWKKSEYKSDMFDIGISYEDIKIDDECNDENTNFVEASVLRVPSYIEQIGSFEWSTNPDGYC